VALLSSLFKHLRNGKERGFGEGVSKMVSTSKDRRLLLSKAFPDEISLFELIERDRSESRIVYIWRHRHCHGKGSHRSSNKPPRSCLINAPQRRGQFLAAASSSRARGAKIGIVHDALEGIPDSCDHFAVRPQRKSCNPMVVALNVLSDDVGASPVCVWFRRLRCRQKEKFKTAFEVLAFQSKSFPAIIGLGKFIALDHRAHCAIEHNGAFARAPPEDEDQPP
jgi:hypothetical protein